MTCQRTSPAGVSALRREPRQAATNRPRGDLAPGGPGAHEVDRAVYDDAVQPGCERALPVEAVEPLERREERLLRDVLRRLGVVGHEPRGTVQRRPVAVEQFGEHRLVAAIDRAQKRRVVAATGLT